MLSLLTLMVLLTGCSQNADTEEIKKFTVAFLPNEADESGALKENFLHLLTELQNALGENYEFDYVIADDYAAVATAIRTGTAHFAWESGNTYATTHMADEDVVPIVSYGPSGVADEEAGYTSYIAVHDDVKAEFESINDEKEKLAKLEGTAFAFVSPTSTSGSLFPSTKLYQYFGPDGEQKFTTRSELQTPGYYFSDVQFGGDHVTTVTLLAQKKVYAAAYCCNYDEEAGAENDIYVISETFVPNGPLWTNSRFVSAEEIELIQDHLVALRPENTDSGFFDEATGFFTDDGHEGSQLKYFFAVDVSYYQAFYDMNNVQ